ncbi:MAG: leucine-rich repeat domain-containing protein, partial [Bacteroidaceae bacterium]|nr:leucine-rich repeat domain-containing protein [Bacteroidaceae bacterium]
MKHKQLSFLLAVLLSMMTGTASAYNAEIEGIYYNLLSETNQAEVTFGDNEYTGNVTIPETINYNGSTYSVTSIGDYAFRDCTGLTSISIPNSVTSIGYQAFNYCDGLTSISIPNSITSIGIYAFYACSGLTSVTIGNSVTEIGNLAFGSCSGLESIIVEAGNTKYDSRDNCNAIIETSSNTLIAGCKNTIIPNSVTSIRDHAFYGCRGLTSVTIPNSVTSIGRLALWNCSGLISITIPNSVTSIGSSAFYGCSGLTSITIPNSVTSIGTNPFSGCSGLESIIVEAGNTKYDSRDNCKAIIETSSNTLITGCKNTIIPNSVTEIGDFAFQGCSGLTSVTIPNSVTEIRGSAFWGCTGLTSVTIGNSVKVIDERAFTYCSGLTSVTCYAESVPTTDISVFYFSPISSATLYVPAKSLAAYAATSPWSEFGSILPIESSFALNDGESYTHDMDTEYDELTYTRTFSNTDWQALYVPFPMKYDDWKSDFEVARINNLHQWDDDDNGTIDRTKLEVVK